MVVVACFALLGRRTGVVVLDRVCVPPVLFWSDVLRGRSVASLFRVASFARALASCMYCSYERLMTMIHFFNQTHCMIRVVSEDRKRHEVWLVLVLGDDVCNCSRQLPNL